MYSRNKNGTSRHVSLRPTAASNSYTISPWRFIIFFVVIGFPCVPCGSSVPPVVKAFSAQPSKNFRHDPSRSPFDIDHHRVLRLLQRRQLPLKHPFRHEVSNTSA